MPAFRTLIIGAIFVTGYLLALAWQEDYAKPIEEDTTTNFSSAVSAPNFATTSSSEESIPGIVNSDQEPQSLSSATIPQDSRFLKIENNLLALIIDKQGGDIVQAKLKQHKATRNSKQGFPLLSPGNQGRLYIAESGLIGPNGIDQAAQRPWYQSSSDQLSIKENNKVAANLMHTDKLGNQIKKSFTLERDSYTVEINYEIVNRTSQNWQAHLFGQIKRDRSPDPTEGSGMGARSFLGAAFTTKENPYEKLSFSDIEEDGPFKQSLQGGWVAMVQHYFVSAWIPNQTQTNNFRAIKLKNQDVFIMGFTGPAIDIAPGEQGSASAQLYLGPKETERLAKLAPHLDLTVDYGFLWFIAQPLFIALSFFHSLVGNWGVAIILLTVLIKTLFFYPSAISYKSMAKMRKMQPKLLALREQHGEDKQKMSQELMALYKKEGANPLSGCLPMLLQMPVFIALYWMLIESVELRHAPFYLWINDLSMMDPYLVLPLLMGVSMFIQQRLNPEPPDPMQAKIMKLMPVIFTIFFLFFPAGLVLYWLVNNLLSITQQTIITRQIEREG